MEITPTDGRIVLVSLVTAGRDAPQYTLGAPAGCGVTDKIPGSTAARWENHRGQQRLAASGPYARVRHPQYVGFVLIMAGFLFQWPTVLTALMFPILVWMYVRLALREERDALDQFGQEYARYSAVVPRFFPTLRRGGAARTEQAQVKERQHSDAAQEEALESLGWGGLGPSERERVQRIAVELEHGFSALSNVEPAVAFFGSARSGEDSSEYEQAREVAREVARAGFNVLTGGGPGVMEAANRGCQEGRGLQVGLSIQLPKEHPVLLFGGSFWSALDDQLNRLERAGMIEAEDRARLRHVSTADEAIGILKQCHEGLCATLGKPALQPR